MRYPASEKLEIIRTVEGSHLPVKQTLDMLCIPRSTFYRWYDLYVDGGLDALADHSPRPRSVWNRIPDAVRRKVVKLALTENWTESMPEQASMERLRESKARQCRLLTMQSLKGSYLMNPHGCRSCRTRHP